MKTPMPRPAPKTVPMSVSCGSGGAGWAAGGGGGAVATAAGGGGRRDGENSGRSRVADIDLNRIVHNGFPTEVLIGGAWRDALGAATVGSSPTLVASPELVPA